MYSLTEADRFQYRGRDIPYILSITLLPSGLAAITSEQILALFDPLQLSHGPKRTYTTQHGNVTALAPFDVSTGGCVVATAGENGTVSLWDLRDGAGSESIGVQAGSCNSVLRSLACDGASHSIAVGSEFSDQTHQSSVIIWDARNTSAPKVQYNEVHSDDIMELAFHPTTPNLLLTGSTDGLLNVLDISISDEDEVITQAFNHGSIHHAGWISATEVFALSHDEKLAVYDTADAQLESGAAAKDFGDAREVLKCQYVADVAGRFEQGTAVVGAGAQDQQMFGLVHLSKNPEWSFDQDTVVNLPGAHGTELVRTFCFLDQQQTVYTGGEDGQIKAWRP